MKPIRIAINGFGRIGRLALRAGLSLPNLTFAALNDLGDAATSAHLLKHDSVHGELSEPVRALTGAIRVGRRTVRVLSEKDPAKLPWKRLRIDVVLECTGRFTKKADALAHVKAGAKRVIISAPSDDADVTVVRGVNEEACQPSDVVVSNASCTTNSLSPVVAVLDQHYSVVRGMMTTVHSYTNDQRILDLEHKDLRRARAAALNIIPTTTGATQATTKTIPHLKGKLEGLALRVPTPCGSITDFVAVVRKAPRDANEVNRTFQAAAARGALQGILEYSDLPLVSSDIVHNPHSAIIDGLSTQVNGTLVRVLAWYDNEWGYANRLVELAASIGAASVSTTRKGVRRT
ncbi:MAG: type I glyceraldehyde-3-phosphate dehydrogenase [Candidatus Kerfeldbacteria bacterium]|nr:type I glyceraldehyde-3-phosphate dehydrogenase [Candidatus Kerfeldbacteria bacterium]